MPRLRSLVVAAALVIICMTLFLRLLRFAQGSIGSLIVWL